MNELPNYLVAFILGAVSASLVLQWNSRVRIRRAARAGLSACQECGRIDP